MELKMFNRNFPYLIINVYCPHPMVKINEMYTYEMVKKE